MKKLNRLLEDIDIIEIIGSQERGVKSLHIDSREVKKSSLFAALTGTRVDGHKFIESAIQKGATSILCESLPKEKSDHVTYIRVKDAASAIGEIAHRFFGKPSEKLKLVGVTGTNGKSTIVSLFFQLFESLGHPSGLISTIDYRIRDQRFESSHTTPDSIRIHGLMSEMVDAGCTHAFMEVSSHAIDQKRISGLQFAGGIFTNISHDHLDYHGTFKKYIAVKQQFFDGIGAQAFALTNDDDPNGHIMVQNTKAKVSKYSLRKVSTFKARIIENTIVGLQLELDGIAIHARLVGNFNAYNLCAVYGGALLLGEEKENILPALSNLHPAEGRFDLVSGTQNDVIGIVDYAHTPDALKKVLSTLLQVRERKQRVIAVVGCGGDRDKTKRPKMAYIATSLADLTILTSDNPRSEDPLEILKEMQEGVEDEDQAKVLTISDRKEAIRTAVKLARKSDLILVAGKGHEKYQEINGVKYPFDDKAILKEELQ